MDKQLWAVVCDDCTRFCLNPFPGSFHGEMMAKSTNKIKVLKEDAKEFRTTHWDMDYLPRKELEKLYTKAERKQDGSLGNRRQKPAVRWAIVVVFGLIGLLLLFLFIFKFVAG